MIKRKNFSSPLHFFCQGSYLSVISIPSPLKSQFSFVSIRFPSVTRNPTIILGLQKIRNKERPKNYKIDQFFYTNSDNEEIKIPDKKDGVRTGWCLV